MVVCFIFFLDFLTSEDVIVMAKDGTVYEGCLRVCDQSTNLVFFPAVVKKLENGKVIKKEHDCFFLRGDEVSFISIDLRAQEHKTPVTV